MTYNGLLLEEAAEPAAPRAEEALLAAAAAAAAANDGRTCGLTESAIPDGDKDGIKRQSHI